VLPPASPSRISTSEQRTPLQTGGSGEQQAARLSRGWRGSYQPRLLHQLLAAENPAVGAAVHVAGAVGAAALELVLLVLLPLTLVQIAAAAVVARNLGDPSRVCTPNTLHPCSGYNVNIYFISLSSLFRKMQTANGLGNGVSMPKGLLYPLGWIATLAVGGITAAVYVDRRAGMLVTGLQQQLNAQQLVTQQQQTGLLQQRTGLQHQLTIQQQQLTGLQTSMQELNMNLES